MEALDLDLGDLERRKARVTIAGQKYVLREATEAVAAEYRNAAARAMRFESGRMRGHDGSAEADAELLSACLQRSDTGAHVSPQEIRDWPTRVTSQLLKTLKQMSGMDDDEDEDSLRDRIADLEAKLERKVRAAREGGWAKKRQRPTTATSASPANSESSFTI